MTLFVFDLFLVKVTWTGEWGGRPPASVHGSCSIRMMISADLFVLSRADSVAACPFVKFRCCTRPMSVAWVSLIRLVRDPHSGGVVAGTPSSGGRCWPCLCRHG